MNRKHFKNALIVAAMLVICGATGCSTWDKLDRTEQGVLIGTGSGAALGGVVGGTKGAVLGGVGGGVAGGVIGHNTDDE